MAAFSPSGPSKYLIYRYFLLFQPVQLQMFVIEKEELSGRHLHDFPLPEVHYFTTDV